MTEPASPSLAATVEEVVTMVMAGFNAGLAFGGVNEDEWPELRRRFSRGLADRLDPPE